MPNHARLARQLAFSDNFYCDSDASIHGHHWMMGTIPNEWVEANAASAGRFDAFSKAPGRRFPKSSGAIDPEDYNEIGGLWEAMERSKVSFYNFGQANEYAGNYEEQYDTTFGTAPRWCFRCPQRPSGIPRAILPATTPTSPTSFGWTSSSGSSRRNG